MNLYKAIEVNAMKAVVAPDEEAKIRQIMRWYSKTFHTPLLSVYDLPLDYLLTHYYEETYSEMEEEIRAEKHQQLAMTEEEWAAHTKAAGDDEDAFIREAEAQAAADAQKHRMATVKPTEDKVMGAPAEPAPEPVVPRVLEPESIIKMRFNDDETIFNELIEKDTLG